MINVFDSILEHIKNLFKKVSNGSEDEKLDGKSEVLSLAESEKHEETEDTYVLNGIIKIDDELLKLMQEYYQVKKEYIKFKEQEKNSKK